jgi:predicted phosphodiesterase
MPQKPESIAAKARQLCREFPDTPTRTLAKRLYKENPIRITNLEAARKAVLAARGANGKRALYMADPASVRPKGKAGWKPECPPSISEPWTPVEIDGPARVLFMSDMHVPFHDANAIEAAVAHGRKLKPTHVVLLGDICDFFTISRWERDPKHRNLKLELDTTKDLLSWLRGQFPKARIIYKLGNHEERWDIFIWNKCVELWNVENVQLHNLLDFEKFGIERVDDSPIMAGKLPALHGHELGRSGIANPVNQARGAFLRTLHTVLVGHGHRTSSHAEGDMFNKEIMCWSLGCLCSLNPRWLRINRWNWGNAFVEVAKDNQFDMQNFRINGEYQARTA